MGVRYRRSPLRLCAAHPIALTASSVNNGERKGSLHAPYRSKTIPKVPKGMPCLALRTHAIHYHPLSPRTGNSKPRRPLPFPATPPTRFLVVNDCERTELGRCVYPAAASLFTSAATVPATTLMLSRLHVFFMRKKTTCRCVNFSAPR